MQTIPTLVATASSCLFVLPNVLVAKYCHGPMLSQLRIISSVGDGDGVWPRCVGGCQQATRSPAAKISLKTTREEIISGF